MEIKNPPLQMTVKGLDLLRFFFKYTFFHFQNAVEALSNSIQCLDKSWEVLMLTSACPLSNITGTCFHVVFPSPTIALTINNQTHARS